MTHIPHKDMLVSDTEMSHTTYLYCHPLLQIEDYCDYKQACLNVLKHDLKILSVISEKSIQKPSQTIN